MSRIAPGLVREGSCAWIHSGLRQDTTSVSPSMFRFSASSAQCLRTRAFSVNSKRLRCAQSSIALCSKKYSPLCFRHSQVDVPGSLFQCQYAIYHVRNPPVRAAD